MTDPRMSQANATPQSSTMPRSTKKWHWRVAGAAAVLGIAAAVSPFAVPDEVDAPVDTAPWVQAAEQWSVASTEADASTPLVTSEQLNAVAKAREYLSLMAFSKSGLIEQLEYEGFSYADSAYAVNKLDADGAVNWNEQAAKKAGDYRSMMAFSRQGLIEQLEYEGFTSAQAVYGADHG